MINCQYCNKQCVSVRSKSAHERFCKLNPDYKENIQKHKQTTIKASCTASAITLKRKAQLDPLNQIKSYILICNKCGKQYTLNLKARDYNNGYYPKTCSSVCAHSRIHSQQTKNKISKGVKNAFTKFYQNINNVNQRQVDNECTCCGAALLDKYTKHTLLCDQCYFKTHKRIDLNDNRRTFRNCKNGQFHKTNCKNCGKEIYTKHIGNTYCYQCADKLNLHHFMLFDKNGKRVVTQSTKEKCRRNTKQLMTECKIKPWKTRNILSYPQKFFINVLQFNHIQYTPNKPQHGYFLDFVIETKHGIIDLEIDGKQHLTRVEHDKKRDEIISALGYIVYRISWNSINNLKGKSLMKEKITKFLNFYNSLF